MIEGRENFTPAEIPPELGKPTKEEMPQSETKTRLKEGWFENPDQGTIPTVKDTISYFLNNPEQGDSPEYEKGGDEEIAHEFARNATLKYMQDEGAGRIIAHVRENLWADTETTYIEEFKSNLTIEFYDEYWRHYFNAYQLQLRNIENPEKIQKYASPLSEDPEPRDPIADQSAEHANQKMEKEIKKIMDRPRLHLKEDPENFQKAKLDDQSAISRDSYEIYYRYYYEKYDELLENK